MPTTGDQPARPGGLLPAGPDAPTSAPADAGYPGWEDEDLNRTEPIPTGSGWSTPAPTARGTARATGPGSRLRITVGDLLTVAGGVFVLLFSFLPFVSYSDDRLAQAAERAKLSTSWSAWAHVTFLAPLSWVIILASVGVAVLGGLRVLNRRQPTLLGFEAAQLRLVLAGVSFLVLLCFALSAKTVTFGDDRAQATVGRAKVDSTLSLDVGGYLMLLAALAMVAGTLITLRSTGGPAVWPLPANLGSRLPSGGGLKKFGGRKGFGRAGEDDDPTAHYPTRPDYASDYLNPPPPGGYTDPPEYDRNPPVDYPDQPPRY